MRCRPVFAALPILAIAALAVAAGCGSAASPGANPHLPKAGLWDVRVELVGSDPPLPPEAAALARAEAERPEVRRQCFPGTLPSVGGTYVDGRCRYTRVEDRGPAANRLAVCEGGLAVETLGTRSAEAYDYRIVTRMDDPATGRARTVTTRERGRWLGPCPQQAR